MTYFARAVLGVEPHEDVVRVVEKDDSNFFFRRWQQTFAAFHRMNSLPVSHP